MIASRKRAGGAGLLLLVVVACFQVSAYYPTTYRIGMLLGVAGFAALSLWRPATGVFLLFASGPFFGNHPGGHFMELFPLLLALWTGAALWHRAGVHFRFVLVGAPMVLAQLLPALLHPWPAFDALHRYADPFHILISDEHNPLYPLQQLLWTAVLFLFASHAACAKTARTPFREYDRAAIAGIATGLVLVIAIGLMESLLPALARSLDAYHIRLDGYVDRAGSHFFPKFASPNSLFWNRSWHGIYFVSSLPFLLMAALHLPAARRRVTLRRLVIPTLLVLLFCYAILIGARGTLLAVTVFALAMLPVAAMTMLPGGGPGRLRLPSLLVVWPVVIAGIALLIHLALPILTVMGNLGMNEPRFGQYAAGLRIFLLFPLTGGGIESYGYYNTNVLQGISMAAPNGTAHSQWLQILSGSGLIGGAAYVAVFAAALLAPFRSLMSASRQRDFFRDERGPGGMAASDAGWHLHAFLQPTIVLAGLASLLVYGTVQEWWYLKPVQAAWWLLMAMAVGVAPGPPTPAAESQESPRSWLLDGTPVLLLAVTACVAFITHLVAPLKAPSVPITHMSRQFVSGDAIRIDDLPMIDRMDGPDTGPMHWYGVEYQGKGRFLILEGTSWILLPSHVAVVRFEGVEKMGQKHIPVTLYAARSAHAHGAMSAPSNAAADHSGEDSAARRLILHCSSATGLNERKGDYDGRRLCAEMVLPDLGEKPNDAFARPVEAEPHRFR